MQSNEEINYTFLINFLKKSINHIISIYKINENIIDTSFLIRYI